jgi:hypothetical protein
MMGDVHGHNNDGSVDTEMASYKSQMGVRLALTLTLTLTPRATRASRVCARVRVRAKG